MNNFSYFLSKDKVKSRKGEAVTCTKLAHSTASPSRGEAERSSDEGDTKKLKIITHPHLYGSAQPLQQLRPPYSMEVANAIGERL